MNISVMTKAAVLKSFSSSLSFSACRHGNEKVFELLLSLGTVTTARNKVGATPLHLACQFKHLNMVKVKKGFIKVPGRHKDTAHKGDFRNGAFVALKWKYFS